MTRKWYLLPIVALLVLGCSSEQAKETKDSTQQKSDSSTDSGKSDATSSTPSEANKTESTPKTEQKLDLSKVVPVLKHDGYRYYSFSNTKPLTMLIKGGPAGDKTGTQTYSLTDANENEATFNVELSGDLPNLPVEYVVKKDGIYARQTGVKDAQLQLQLPATLKTGFSWTTTEKLTVEGKDFVVKQTNKIVGPQTVKVNGKTYQAILVSGSGTNTVQNITSKIQTKCWYVKDIGPIKTEMINDSGGKPVQLVITAK